MVFFPRQRGTKFAVTFYIFYRANPASGFFQSQANLYYSLCQHLPDDRTEEAIKYFLFLGRIKFAFYDAKKV